jgi:uncharacterized protein
VLYEFNMNTRSLTFLLAITFLFNSSSIVCGDEIQDGFDSYKRKKYKEAVNYFHVSAVQGDALAQLLLGLMYNEGKGVNQNFAEAVKWYRRSAELGNSSAQNNLGFMYSYGHGINKDYVLAHMWFSLSFSNGSEHGLEGRKMIEKKMTPSQINKAKEMERKRNSKNK